MYFEPPRIKVGGRKEAHEDVEGGAGGLRVENGG